MSKGLRIVLNIIYYLLMFALGIMLALFLPYIYLYDAIIDDINNAIVEKDFAKAIECEMGMCGGYYNDELVYETQLSDTSGLVLFEASTLNNDNTKIYNSYLGLLYGIKGEYNTYLEKDNPTKILINDEQVIKIIDFDADNDQENDSSKTALDEGFVFFVITYDLVSLNHVDSIEFIDRDNQSFYKVDNLGLGFNSTYFIDVAPFTVAYNENSSTENSEVLNAASKEFLDKSEHYKININLEDQAKVGAKRATPIVIIYFIVVYLIGDSLIGLRLLPKFFKWLFVKVFKVKIKEKTPKKEVGTFVGDYYSKVEITASCVKGTTYEGLINVRFSNQSDELSVSLNCANNYSAQARVKAGIYGNPWIEIDEGYEVLDLPTNLVVEGYFIKLELKVRKK